MRFLKLISATVMIILFTASMAYAVKFNNLKGWNYTAIYGQSTTASGIDINGEVGHPVTVNGLTANCEPGGSWSANTEIISGEFPPGISKGSGGSKISGIPTQRGHWIVEMRASDLECNGEYFKGFTQQLRFHISGSGRVIQ